MGRDNSVFDSSFTLHYKSIMYYCDKLSIVKALSMQELSVIPSSARGWTSNTTGVSSTISCI